MRLRKDKMNKILLLIGIWIGLYMLSVVSLITIDTINNPSKVKMKDNEIGFFLIIPLLISTCITFIIGGLIL